MDELSTQQFNQTKCPGWAIAWKIKSNIILSQVGLLFILSMRLIEEVFFIEVHIILLYSLE